MKQTSEAFVYLWYDAPNDMYYLGKHKGSPDDEYTHSSSIWESFTKDNIPEGVTREILADGTHEEMCILEHELLVKAKNGGDWDRYYNQSLGDPRYVDQWRENNPSWKGGITYDMTAYKKKYYATPEYRVSERARQSTPEYTAWRKEYDKKLNATPERKKLQRIYQAKLKAKKKSERQGEGTLEAYLK